MTMGVKIALLTPWLSNNGGGVVAVVAALARSLARVEGVSVHVLGLAESDETLHEYDWSGAEVYGLHASVGSAIALSLEFDKRLAAIAPDVVHVHGLWTYPSIAAERWRARGARRGVIISPHGMLEPWALSNSGWKKWIAGAVFQRRALRGASCVHALTASEYNEIRAYAGAVPTAVIPNGVDMPQDEPAPLDRDSMRHLLYLGRLHPKKNLVGLLEAWARSGSAREGWQLDIAGWDQGGYRSELEARVAALGLADSVRFLGGLFGREKDAAFRSAAGFVLPSFSEGLPMAVLEAWSYGKPVLMTDACNLEIGFSRGAAARMGATQDSAVRDLAAYLAMPPSALIEMGGHGRALVAEHFTWCEVAMRFMQLYRWSAGDAAAPDYLDEV